MAGNKVAIRKPTFAKEAREINQTFERADVGHEKARNLRITAGEMMDALRPKVEEAGHTWSKWAKEHLTRSLRDIRRILKIARSENPTLALTQEREKRRITDRRRAERTRRVLQASAPSNAVTLPPSKPMKTSKQGKNNEDGMLRALAPWWNSTTKPKRLKLVKLLTILANKELPIEFEKWEASQARKKALKARAA